MLRSSRETLLAAAAVFIVTLVLYSYTLAPTVTLVDSGELIVAVHSLGVAHPPGFPLYLLLAHAVSLLPLGNVAMRVNFASAVFAALAAAMLTSVVATLMASVVEVAPKNKRPARNGAFSRERALIPAVAAALLFSFSRTLWSYATVTEVYTLNTFLILCLVLLMLHWAAGRNEMHLYAAALLFGLALGVHHVTVGLTLPAFALLVWRSEGAKFYLSRRLVCAALISFAGLCAINAYLPLAAARAPVLVWGDPRSLAGVWRHVTGREYQGFFQVSGEIVARQLVAFCTTTLRQFGWFSPALLFALAGSVFAFKASRTVFWFLLTMLVTNVVYGLGYDIAEDKDAYYLPAFIVLAIFIAFGLRWLLEMVISRNWSTRTAAALALALPLLALAGNWQFNNRRHYTVARDYVLDFHKGIAPNGLLLTLDWQVAAPMLYTREIEGQRRDIKVVDVNLLRRSWYLAYLRRAYPEMMQRALAPAERFLSSLRAWEQDPRSFQQNVGRTREIEVAYHELLRALVRQESDAGPVYVTHDVMFLTEGSDRQFTNWLLQNRQLAPRGLAFQLVTERGFHDPGDARLPPPRLTNGTMAFEQDDVVRVKVLPAYARMLLQTARYLAFYNQHERAIAAFEQALAIEPGSKLAREGLAQSKARLGPR
jgi:tetratricopeptide (TPR) repeat protein